MYSFLCRTGLFLFVPCSEPHYSRISILDLGLLDATFLLS